MKNLEFTKNTLIMKQIMTLKLFSFFMLSALVLGIFACGGEGISTDIYVGEYSDKKNEKPSVKITKEGGRYIAEFKRKKNGKWQDPLILMEAKKGNIKKHAQKEFGDDWENVVEGAIGNKMGFIIFKVKPDSKVKKKAINVDYYYVHIMKGSGNLYKAV